VVEICGAIRQGIYAAGDRLPPERELAERLQVSRPSLREALRVLELTGIVESRHGGGTFVLDADPTGIASPLTLLLEATSDAVGELWEVRLIVEPAIAARAAVQATPEAITQLEDLVSRFADSVANHASHDAVLRIDRDFHIALATASGNRVAVRVLALINELLLDGWRHFITSQARRNRALAAHREILDALRLHDSERAREAMLRHLEETESFILDEVIGQPPERHETPVDAAEIA
jgi:GntR family transcriptional repressor for pyruvate dehydrogenase complex